MDISFVDNLTVSLALVILSATLFVSAIGCTMVPRIVAGWLPRLLWISTLLALGVVEALAQAGVFGRTYHLLPQLSFYALLGFLVFTIQRYRASIGELPGGRSKDSEGKGAGQ